MTSDFYCDEVFSGKTPVEKVYETGRVLAYYHTKPNWPVHIVVVPKEHIESILELEDEALMSEMLDVLKKVSSEVLEKEGKCRIITNLGEYQDSRHLHWHVCAGEEKE